MKAVYGHVRNVKAMSSTGDTIIEVVVPVEVHRAVVDLVFGRDVLVTLAPPGMMPGLVDSDKLQPAPAGQASKATPETKPSQRAAILCKDPDFWRFHSIAPGAPSRAEEMSRAYILATCGIDSRAELDSTDGAAELFTTEVLDPFNRWMRGDPPVIDKSGALV